jgi:hypothetical protein
MDGTDDTDGRIAGDSGEMGRRAQNYYKIKLENC